MDEDEHIDSQPESGVFLELDALDTEGGDLLKWESSPHGVAVGGADRW